MVTRGEDVARGEVDLEGGDAVRRAGRGADLGGKSGSGQIVADDGRCIGEAAAGSCIPSPESSAKRTTTRSFFSSVLLSM